ncbi:hypothetical protein ACMGE7_09755 [Macrococcus equi]
MKNSVSKVLLSSAMMFGVVAPIQSQIVQAETTVACNSCFK